jgi:hypothetical protein
MNRTRWLLLFGLLAAFAGPAVGRAQDGGRDYRLLPGGGSLDELKKRLQDAAKVEEILRALEELKKDPKKLEALAKLAQSKSPPGKDLDPLTRDVLKQLQATDKNGRPDPEKLKEVKEVLEQQKARIEGKGAADPGKADSKIKPFPPPAPDRVAPPAPKDPLKNFLNPSKLARDVERGRYGRLGEMLKHGNAFRRFREGLDGHGGPSGKGKGAMPAGLPDIAGGLLQKWQDGRESTSASGGATTGPALGPGNLGTLAGPPSFQMPAGGGDGALGLVQVLLLVGIGAAVAFVIWRLLARARPRDVEAELRRSAWPLPPGQVTTRAQLIQAFEHLALVVLGPAARATNHRAIASGLGATAERSRAAAELAGLYEWARYDPTEGELPAADRATARRDLCLLAGMAAS